jgi:DNA-binding NarL/FixJ family response regulator
MQSVLLIEGHQLLRNALKNLLVQSGIEIVLEASDPLEAIKQTVGRSPQIIVLDIFVLQMEGLYLTQILRTLAPRSKIVLLLENTGPDYQAAVKLSGADAFVDKSTLTEDLPPLVKEFQHESLNCA